MVNDGRSVLALERFEHDLEVCRWLVLIIGDESHESWSEGLIML